MCVSKNTVFPRNRIQGSTKFSAVDHIIHWIFVMVQKDSNAKKEGYCCMEPERLFTKFTTLNKKSKKENRSFFFKKDVGPVPRPPPAASARPSAVASARPSASASARPSAAGSRSLGRVLVAGVPEWCCLAVLLALLLAAAALCPALLQPSPSPTPRKCMVAASHKTGVLCAEGSLTGDKWDALQIGSVTCR
jgi:hypothetical protein